MRALQRIQSGNPVLRKKAKSISVSKIKSEEIQTLIKQMFFTLKGRGVGLAAPQVGRSVRLIVIDVPEVRDRKKIKPLKKTVVINPRILEFSKKKEDGWEGCLSLPGIRAKVPRSTSIVVAYYNEHAEEITKTYTGLHARVFQHEIDHLDGILHVDQVEDTTTIITESEYQKRVKKNKKKSEV